MIEYLEKKIVQLRNSIVIDRNKLEKKRAIKKYVEKLIADKSRHQAALRKVEEHLRQIGEAFFRNS